MRLLKMLLMAASMMAVAPIAALAQPAKPIPLRDFFRNPEQAGHQVSPDGRYISYARSRTSDASTSSCGRSPACNPPRS